MARLQRRAWALALLLLALPLSDAFLFGGGGGGGGCSSWSVFSDWPIPGISLVLILVALHHPQPRFALSLRLAGEDAEEEAAAEEVNASWP